MTWPAVVLWILILFAAVRRGPLLLYVFSATMVFGSLTVFPAGSGVNVTAQSLCAVLLIVKTVMRRDAVAGLCAIVFDMKRLGFLFLFSMYSLFAAIFLPRLFSGDVLVFPLNDSWRGEALVSPSSANFSQSIYLLLSAGIALVFSLEGKVRGFRRHYFNSVLIAGILLVVSGVIDQTAALTGYAKILNPFHNASYALLTDVELAGQKRVVGFMPEASAFGAACVTVMSFLIFCFDAFERRYRRDILPITIFSLIIMIYLSTSSTGYLGVIVALGALLMRVLLAVLVKYHLSRGAVRLMSGVLLCVFLVSGYAIVFAPGLVHSFVDHLNIVLFQKENSGSYRERSAWTSAGLKAFWATHGFGVGVGSVRTSNWFVNILASTGAIGVILLIASIVTAWLALRRQTEKSLRDLGRALIWSTIPIGATMGVSGTTPDPGVFSMAILGLLVGISNATQLDVALDAPSGECYRTDPPYTDGTDAARQSG